MLKARQAALAAIIFGVSSVSLGEPIVSIYGQTVGTEAFAGNPELQALSGPEEHEYKQRLVKGLLTSAVLKHEVEQRGTPVDPQYVERRKEAAGRSVAKSGVDELIGKFRLIRDLVPLYRAKYGKEISAETKAAFCNEVKTSASMVKLSQSDVNRAIDEYTTNDAKFDGFVKMIPESKDDAIEKSIKGWSLESRHEALKSQIVAGLAVTPEETEAGKAYFEQRRTSADQSYEDWVRSAKADYIVNAFVLDLVEKNAQFASSEQREQVLSTWKSDLAYAMKIFGDASPAR